ncbi:MAG: hypothetical protein ABFR53_11930, partial [Actinomycetota bacterium]
MRSLFHKRFSLVVAAATAVLLLIPAAALSSAGHDEGAMTVADVEFIGEVIVSTGEEFGGTEIGGLSSITFDESRQVYYTVSDDQGNRPTGDPVRYYTVEIDFADGSLDPGDV